jgi:hypothetical protein
VVSVRRRAADKSGMNAIPVECLRCGHRHSLDRAPQRELTDSECPRCGYLGWAHASALDEAARRSLRERPIELRLRATA